MMKNWLNCKIFATDVPSNAMDRECLLSHCLPATSHLTNTPCAVHLAGHLIAGYNAKIVAIDAAAAASAAAAAAAATAAVAAAYQSLPHQNLQKAIPGISFTFHRTPLHNDIIICLKAARHN